jgi:crotonobetainyl-CoA:carnitine CoA-transferase CaiB-like acyl-CoA transferase
VRISDADVPAHRIAPELGEHSEQILLWLGVGSDRFRAMVDRNAARQFTQ